jgi:hypothetical protein
MSLSKVALQGTTRLGPGWETDEGSLWRCQRSSKGEQQVNHSATVQILKAREQLPPRGAQTKRYFHSIAGVVMLLVTFVGFQPFYLRGEGMGGRTISPELFLLVLVHGAAMTAWMILFLIQSLLIPTRNRRLHMKLGWGAIAVASVVTISGFMVAVQSVRPVPEVPFWGMAYRQFLLVMLAEVTLFTVFVLAGVLSRKRPEIHRAMMLLASLSILAGATVRIPILFPIFGEGGWMGIFGPIFTLGALFLLVRSLLSRVFDRWFAAGYAAMIVFYVVISTFAVSDAWSWLARAVFNT